ncbi:hypothetical protein [Thermogymnomonas acidicola]|uniref:hypothetical protein n=1 Tax=Thermogymnomonas acidicola TaxID=399579 RepID=UPI0009465EDA|nr:hypothetical protein [Thermogymnomonas acidicola]
MSTSLGGGVPSVQLEPVRNHGFRTWQFLASIPGSSVRVKQVDLGSEDLVFVFPKWVYNCPVVNGFLSSADLGGRRIALAVTYTSGNISGYVERLTRKIGKRGGGKILLSMPVKRGGSEEDREKFIDGLRHLSGGD